jgi:oligopeptide transport system substrate-binding protein
MKLGLTYHSAFDFRAARQAYEEGFALRQRAGEMQPAVPAPLAPHALRMCWELATALDPTMAKDAVSTAIIEQLFSGLVEHTPEMDVVPDVARSWEVSEGGRRYVFHLREDLRWSDGTLLTAGDFEFAWKRALDPATGSPNASMLYDVKGGRSFHQGDVPDPDSVGVRALDEVTLLVELEGPTGYFLHLLAHGATYPVPRHAVEAHGAVWTELEKIVTNGPFRLEAWKAGEIMVFLRNPGYHGRFTGNLQRVEVFPIMDPAASVELYGADELDTFHVCDLPPAEMDRARQRYAGEYVSVPNLGTEYLAFDVSRPPFDDPRLRRALVLATDRERIADVVLRGTDLPATGGFVPAGMLGHSAGIALPYDPEQARQLLAGAGYPGGRGFPAVNLLVARKRVARSEYLQAQWREHLGIEIAPEIVDYWMFLDRLDKEPPHMWILAWTADYPDPDNFLRVAFPRQETGWRNEAYYRLVDEARRVTDQEERNEMYQQADRILVEEAPIMPLAYGSCHLLVKPWVRRYPTSGRGFWYWKDVVIEPH